MTEIEDLAVQLPCSYCKALPEQQCRTKAGSIARGTHDARNGGLWNARSTGYREGYLSALRNAAEELRRRRQGERWTIRDNVPLVGLDVVAHLEARADRWEAL